MPRLIDADKLGLTDFEIVMCDGDYKEALKMVLGKIEDAPTVDAVPLEDYKSMEQTVNKLTKAIADAEKHGHWCVTQAYPHTVYCSECFKRFAQAHWAVWEDGSLPRDYCPNCGAKMDAPTQKSVDNALEALDEVIDE